MPSPAREYFESKDKRSYTLWIDIHDVMNAAVPTYWRETVDARRERGWIFRGQANADWGLVPSLYRPPLTDDVLEARARYTTAFKDAVRENAGDLGLTDLSDLKLTAIAQHYGLYTQLLDFTWNLEVAAYFATWSHEPWRTGAIFAYSVSEYESMRNPFACLGTSLEDAQRLMLDGGLTPLPPCRTVEFDDIPRVRQQEGLFIECPRDRISALLDECIDRYYFHQRTGLVYRGGLEHRKWALLGRGHFDSDNTYDSFLELARESLPHLFDKTPGFGGADLFPPLDRLSQFAKEWKDANPDPTAGCSAPPRTSIPVQRPLATDTQGNCAHLFRQSVEAFYYSRTRRTPYTAEYTRPGRELIESLCEHPQLDLPENRRWLLWELFQLVLGNGGYRCTVKLDRRPVGDGSEQHFSASIIDRWIEEAYRLDFGYDDLRNGPWQAIFERPASTRLDVADLAKVQTFSADQSGLHSTSRSNPYRGDEQMRHILGSVKRELSTFSEGEDGSLLYDLQWIVQNELGRSLRLTVGLVGSGPCHFASSLVDCAHADGERMVLEIYDGFFRSLKHAAVCTAHWRYYCEGDINLMDPDLSIRLGLA